MLINCVAYEEGTKLADIAVAAIGDYLARPGCFVWVALKDASADELLEMQRQFHLHDLAVEDARHGHQRPKIEEYGDTVFMVMHMIEYSSTDDLQVAEVCVFVGPNFVLSVRSHSTRVAKSDRSEGAAAACISAATSAAGSGASSFFAARVC